MKNRLLSLSLALIFTASSYGIFTTGAAQSQCGCSCSYLCSGTCTVSCSDCTINDLMKTAEECCAGERQNVQPYCPASGTQT